MKKIILLIFLILASFISLNTSAASWRFIWQNTVIDIPLGESIEKYKYLPKAILYKNGVALTDASINYLRDGDWLYYLSDVNTRKVGTYYVWYKAFENDKYKPGTCNDYKCKIEFNVIDNIAPEITILNNNLSIRAQSNYNLLDNVVAKDNYYDELEYKINSNINYEIPGDYLVDIYVTDGSKNVSHKSFNVNIFDNSIPQITKIKSEPLKFIIGEVIDLSSYFSAYDDVDKDITNKIIYPNILSDEVGINTYTIKVADSALNEASLDIEVEIYDPYIPEISLFNESIILDYETNFKAYDFKKYVKEIKDNETVDYSKLIIETNLENKVGEYYVDFKYNDGTHEVLKTLNVNLVSFDKPTIDTKTISILEGEYVDLASYIEVYDASDSNIASSLIIYDNDVNYYKAGVYKAEAYAINSSGISTTQNIEVKVLNNKDYNKMLGNDVSFEMKDIIYISIMFGMMILFAAIFIFVIFILKRKKKI